MTPLSIACIVCVRKCALSRHIWCVRRDVARARTSERAASDSGRRPGRSRRWGVAPLQACDGDCRGRRRSPRAATHFTRVILVENNEFAIKQRNAGTQSLPCGAEHIIWGDETTPNVRKFRRCKMQKKARKFRTSAATTTKITAVHTAPATHRLFVTDLQRLFQRTLYTNRHLVSLGNLPAA